MLKEIDLDKALRQPTPQDVIAAVFAYSGLELFPSDRRQLHSFVRQKKQGEAAKLLDRFIFSEGVDLFPFSRLLESVLLQLQLGGWLSAKNPEYERFGMTPETREIVKSKVAERFSKEDVEVLKRLGEDFRKAFSGDSGK